MSAEIPIGSGSPIQKPLSISAALTQLGAQSDNIKNSYAGIISSLDDQINILKKEIEDLKSQISNLTKKENKV